MPPGRRGRQRPGRRLVERTHDDCVGDRLGEPDRRGGETFDRLLCFPGGEGQRTVLQILEAELHELRNDAHVGKGSERGNEFERPFLSNR